MGAQGVLYALQFNVHSFRGLATIHKYFVREYLDVTVNGHVDSSSQLMTSCVTKMATIGYGATSLRYSSFVPKLLLLLLANMSICPTWYPTRHHARFGEDCDCFSLNGEGCTEISGEHHVHGCS